VSTQSASVASFSCKVWFGFFKPGNTTSFSQRDMWMRGNIVPLWLFMDHPSLLKAKPNESGIVCIHVKQCKVNYIYISPFKSQNKERVGKKTNPEMLSFNFL